MANQQPREIIVGDPICHTRVNQIDEYEDVARSTHFSIYIKAAIRRHQPGRAASDENWSVSDTTVQLQYEHPNHNMGRVISEVLFDLNVPLQSHPAVVDKIRYEAYRWARLNDSYFPGREVYHMSVYVEVCLFTTHGNGPSLGHFEMDLDLDLLEDDGELALQPASESSLEELERIQVEILMTCSICLDEIAVGSEGTRMPCGHVYHDICIVTWLERSGVCPLCRHAMPADDDEIM